MQGLLKVLVPSLHREDYLEKGMGTHCSILTWIIPWTEEDIPVFLPRESHGQRRLVDYSS